VSEESLRWVKRFADENNLFIHLHLCETEKERKDCIKEKGLTPVRYLEKIGVLGPNLIAAHCNWLEEDDVRVLVDYGVKVVMNPTSNMKLASCGKSPYHRIKEKGGTCLLGTDGPSSNNNLDMFEAMKMAALFEKLTSQDPTHLSSEEAFSMSTREPALAIGINCGVLEVGKLADLLLIDLGRPEFVPGHNFISDLVYATSGACVDTVICDGKILMKDGKVKDEEVIKEKVRERIYNLFKRQ
jgi:5-methylthioadenosine/S-adenosylhomocysteine deaminase